MLYCQSTFANASGCDEDPECEIKCPVNLHPTKSKTEGKFSDKG